ncbi:uncharacterized protein YbjT (DUF2867 family) [Bradyrhizobium elkanii]|nr:hypothetical protein [Bradyrhizobium elkanii]RYM15771.1 hypothetical protein EWH13_38705 [Bradyrhizobium elkanii]RYM17338.1 hypothetical protein EWH13_38365 [Bradyrhizobium elkanii]
MAHARPASLDQSGFLTDDYVTWLDRLIPGRFGVIEQDDIARAFVAEFVDSAAHDGVVYLENGAMRRMSRTLK